MKKTHRPLTVIALMLALFMAAMETTVVSTAMPTVIREMGGLSLYAWVFTAYMLASTVMVPLYGKLSDIYGRKPVMLFGIVLFLVGSMASGQARTMHQLIAFRALQGLGAGAMQPMAITVVGDIFNLEERSRMQGVFGAVWGVAGLIGPFLGGVIVHALSWRWIFYINVPFGIASAVILVFSLHENIAKKPHTLDIGGALVLTAAIVSLLIGSQGWHGAILLPVAAALFVLFILIERRVREPILPIDLFMQRVIAVSSATSALAGAAMFSMITYVPLYVQGVLGGDPTDAGAAIGPMVVAWPIASAVAGRLLTKIGFRPLIRIGLLLVALSSIALALLLRPGAPVWIARVVAIGFGTGLGLSQTASLIAVQSSVGFEQRGVATSSTMFFRIIGSTLGVGALGAVLAATFRATAASVSPELVNQMLGPERRSLDPAVLRSMSGTLQAGLGTIFWSICALSIAAFVVGLFFPPLSTKDRAVAVATTDEAAPISGPIELG
jgi:EmrB/QacA subfamily drug resistance transporter